MSAKLMGECYELDFAAFATKVVSGKSMQDVAQALADHAHDDGRSAWPSVGYLAWKTGLSTRSVQRALTRLEQVGAIEAIGADPATARSGGRQPTTWQLWLARVPRKKPYEAKGGRQSDTRDNLAPLPESVVTVTPGVTPVSPEPSFNQEPSTTSQVPAEVVQIRPRNEVWDALTELFGPPGTRQKEIARGKVVAELRAAGVERAEQVHRLAAEYRRTFSEEVALTQHALGKHADQLAHAIRGRQAKRAVSAPCEFCGVGAGMHDADCVRPQAASA